MVTDWWPVLPGKASLLGSVYAHLCQWGQLLTRRRTELPNNTTMAGEGRDTWVHTVLGLKVAGRALIYL